LISATGWSTRKRENGKGFLGLAFHPKYKENGQFFVYYTSTAAPHLSVISRFRVSKDNPNKADPKSEEELLRIPQPYWNHKRRHDRLWPGRLSLHRPRGRGGVQRPARQRPEAEHAARQDSAD